MNFDDNQIDQESLDRWDDDGGCLMHNNRYFDECCQPECGQDISNPPVGGFMTAAIMTCKAYDLPLYLLHKVVLHQEFFVVDPHIETDVVMPNKMLEKDENERQQRII